MTQPNRPLCAQISSEAGEPLAATASRVDNWLLIEYQGVWSRDVLGGSRLPESAKDAVRAQLALLPHARLLFIRRPERRHVPRRRVYLVHTAEQGASVHAVEIEDYAELAHLDVLALLSGSGGATHVRHPLLVVCTHGKRDRCCARYGRPLFERLRDWVNEDWVWQSTHLGGDRFAGNLVCLPEGLYFGRVGAADAWPLVDEYLSGRVHLACYRGRSIHPFPVQAAERAVREVTGLTGLDEVRVLGSKRAGEGWLVRLEAGGQYEVDVRREQGELTYLTCDAVELKRPRRFVAGAPRAISSAPV